MMRTSSVLVVIAGLWAAGVPWFGPLLGLGAMSNGMMGGMGGPTVVVTAQTLWYHVVPGVVAILVGLYQLVAPSWATRGARRREPRLA
jgi:hypothetical protein